MAFVTLCESENICELPWPVFPVVFGLVGRARAVVDPLGFSRILQCDSLRLVLDLLFDLDGLFYSGNLNFNRWFCSDRSNFFGVGFAAEIERG